LGLNIFKPKRFNPKYYQTANSSPNSTKKAEQTSFDQAIWSDMFGFLLNSFLGFFAFPPPFKKSPEKAWALLGDRFNIANVERLEDKQSLLP
jgi:hypothetical protein